MILWIRQIFVMICGAEMAAAAPTRFQYWTGNPTSYESIPPPAAHRFAGDYVQIDCGRLSEYGAGGHQGAFHNDSQAAKAQPIYKTKEHSYVKL